VGAHPARKATEGASTTKGQIMAEAKKTSRKAAQPTDLSSKAKATEEALAKVETKKLKSATKTIKAPVIKVAKKAIKAAATDKPAAEATVTVADEQKVGKVTKAGKHSTKALKEAEAKAVKEEHKTHKEEADKPAIAPKAIKVRTHLERQGKKIQTASKLVEKNKDYSLKEACDLVIKTSPVKFDATVELHVRLGVDPKLADQNIRASLVLPNGTGKTLKVAVIAEADKVDLAKKAGADIAGSDEFLQQLEKQLINFDVLIATPTMMPKLGKDAKLLGPKGLMPNPKSGTVTVNVVKAVKEAKAGKIEYRIDSNGIVHLGIGKVSFGADKLQANIATVLTSIKNSRPSSVKSTYILSIFITSSMGPSIKVSSNDI
jgi:large subunit ribosomal protein L1